MRVVLQLYKKDFSCVQQASNPDPDCGLYIRNRKGEEVRGVIPKDCLAFQIGQVSTKSCEFSLHFILCVLLP